VDLSFALGYFLGSLQTSTRIGESFPNKVSLLTTSVSQTLLIYSASASSAVISGNSASMAESSLSFSFS